MKIVYVAKHYQNDNDDEGSVADALASFGHEVIRIQEDQGSQALAHQDADFLLFHKWDDVGVLEQLKMPAVFWYFDLVEFDETPFRSSNRVMWMQKILPYVKLGFCTDGDFVAKNSHKLKVLRQGADQRLRTQVSFSPGGQGILFAGSRNGGKTRQSFVDQMQRRYAGDFTWLRTGKGALHGPRLIKCIDKHAIVVAPDSPVTGRYWSNRVYVMLGFGAFLLHPHCAHLRDEYRDGEDIIYYNTREDLHAKIEHWRHHGNDQKRFIIQANAFQKTHEFFTYQRRVSTLLATVQKEVACR